MGQIVSFPRTVQYGSCSASTVDRQAGYRFGNASKPRMEIRYGDDRIYKLDSVVVDYLKTPQTIRLTQDELDSQIDTSQVLEFPDYGCNEIVNEIVHLKMLVTSDCKLMRLFRRVQLVLPLRSHKIINSQIIFLTVVETTTKHNNYVRIYQYHSLEWRPLQEDCR